MDGQGGPGGPDQAVPGTRRPPRRRRSRTRTLIGAAAIVAAGGVATAATLGLGGGPGNGAVASNLPPNTAKVTKETLKDTQEADGELGYGPVRTAVSRLPGTITTLPGSGSTITRGRALYEVDDRPVTLMYGSKPAYRTMREGTEGADVEQLEKNLSALGYDGFTVDGEYTSGTAAAVAEWQDDRGLEETGTVELGRVAFAPGAVRVDGLEAEEGDPVSPGRKVFTYTGTDKAVTVELETSDQRLAKKGARVDITLPGDRTVQGRIDEVSTVIDPGGQGEDPTTRIEVVVWLTDAKARKAAASLTQASVDVAFTAETRENVLTVPVTALLALQEGGFGVEVVKGGSTSYVAVETGLFAGGRVEVSGNGITEGTVVGVPK
ncbi:efflux RND transporter periplasmic adaptor subunit [Actinomadura viridis]|uniref:Peptidoglycan hydrolase-like protein with peptidoglycan-binding domain n=1 Tax=Actinomadura viridis TaxID=58110 RepID=A0A931DU12_9ACTN|nr:peptidoglycan-binding protein [Actinomadura viridis]MBG6093851.1 peptidoglycan hydrolase-like protein with peptidoglycan-binding domain [Actinomadura viridis]